MTPEREWPLQGADSEGSNEGPSGSQETGCPEFPGDPWALRCSKASWTPPALGRECKTVMLAQKPA